MSNYKLTGKECLGIEFGSTRIKAVLIDESFKPIATSFHDWENRLENGYWTYHIDDIWTGLQDVYTRLNEECMIKFGEKIKSLSSIGFSAMMHGYLPFNNEGNLIAEFRTWRNTTTSRASAELTELFNFNIPQRWSISHLYQAVLNGEEHVKDIAYITTLAGYIHWMLTGEKVLGIGEASGMFPIDSNICDYDAKMLDKFSKLERVSCYDWNIKDILPKVMLAGDSSCRLTEEGAKLLDLSGNLQSGCIVCPPEGDAGTGMVATNSIAVKTGNISAGTSIFSMIVLEKQLKNVYEEIDMVTTPVGKPVAMVHCNNCCTDLDYWVRLFIEFSEMSGSKLTKPQIYDMLYNSALKSDADCGGVVTYNFFSGEPVVGTTEGRPLLMRTENAKFNISNFMRAQIYSTMASLKIGMEILDNEKVEIERLMGHGGLFKTPVVGQRMMAGAMNTPITVMSTAGEGGAWGIAVLAKYSFDGAPEPLDEYLDNRVFSGFESITVEPDDKDVEGFANYMKLYKDGLAVEKSAIDNI